METKSLSFTGWHKIKLPEIKSPNDKMAANYILTHLGGRTSRYRIPDEAAKLDKESNSMLVKVFDYFDNAYEEKVNVILKDCNNILKNDAVSKMYVAPATAEEVGRSISVVK